MINKELLGKMKKDATIISTSRGSLANESDIVEFLDNHPEFTYCTDVFIDEPANKEAVFDKVLAQHSRVYGTHHIGGSTKQAEGAIGEEAYRMILEFQKSGNLPNCVNLEKDSVGTNFLFKVNSEGNATGEILNIISKQNLSLLDVKFDAFQGGEAGILKIRTHKLNDSEKQKLHNNFVKFSPILGFNIEA